MKLDYDILAGKQNIVQKSQYVRDIMGQCEKDDPIFLSDAIVRGGHEGSTVLYELSVEEEKSLRERRDPTLWKILVMSDEWGNVPGPGDTVYKVNKRSLRRGDKLVSSNELNMAKMDGTYDAVFEEKRPYTVDEKGCIECSFTDAGYFLQTRGKHSGSNRPITTQRELSTEPFKSPSGNMLHIHYWLYREITKEEYARLPKREVSKGKKRGVKND